MENFEKSVAAAIEKRKREGLFFTSRIPRKQCGRCGQTLEAGPAVCWGRPVPGYLMLLEHDHRETIEPLPTGLSTEVRIAAEYVVLVYGRPCFLTAGEKEAYTAAVADGLGIIEIRGYVFDRLYPIIPFSTWQDDEQKRNRRAETVIIE